MKEYAHIIWTKADPSALEHFMQIAEGPVPDKSL
ncbi:hypothetical protein PsAD13_01033 [Pseudovibrio sp. Ad13]|nr:hypothetical protein PsAD13_01033 [Pseudovibrio sp. Ad13]